MLTIKETTALDSQVYQDALQIRTEVFVQEQGVSPEDEIAGEQGPVYFVGYLNETPVCTARAFEEKGGVWHIQRVAVKKDQRQQKLGAKLMLFVEESARKKQVKKLVLGAQDQAQNFYLKQGFQIVGAGFLEAGIEHHQMEKHLVK